MYLNIKHCIAIGDVKKELKHRYIFNA